MSRTSFNEVLEFDPMRPKTLLLVAILVPQLSIAGGTLTTAELDPLMAQMPEVRDFLLASLRLSDSAYAEIRLGPRFVNLSGARTGPYTIEATSTKDGKPLVVVLCTSIRFLDSKGRALAGARIEKAASIKEKLDGVMLRPEGVGLDHQPC